MLIEVVPYGLRRSLDWHWFSDLDRYPMTSIWALGNPLGK